MCDGKVPGCKKTNCYKKKCEGPCCHTPDIAHAINFEKKSHAERESFWEVVDMEKKVKIFIKIKKIEILDRFIEKKIAPLMEKYPYAEICIEVDT